MDNTQITIFGGFAPNSESAETLSKALGTKTVQSGSVSMGKDQPSQSLQMMERALMTADELKSLPKGTFIVMKTGAYPMQVHLKLFFEWGISFDKEAYSIPDQGNRRVQYADRKQLQEAILKKYPPSPEQIRREEEAQARAEAQRASREKKSSKTSHLERPRTMQNHTARKQYGFSEAKELVMKGGIGG